jgi:Ala-tRNA(Pro) deacylase
MALNAAPGALVHVLELAGVDYELLPHLRTESAAAEAEILGVDAYEVAKTLVVTTPKGLVRAVIPASQRLDLARVEEVLAVGDAELLTEEALAGAYPDVELGAVPPFGGPDGDRVLVDRCLVETESVVLEAGTHEESVRLKTSDLLTLADAQIAHICAS